MAMDVDVRPPRVLVADDEESIRTLVMRLLRRQGYDAVEAFDGRDAIEKLDAARYDAVVLDLMMPRVDGFGVVAHLIETNPTMVEKTLVMTAFPQAAARERLHHLCRVLAKPFEMDELVSAVQDCTER